MGLIRCAVRCGYPTGVSGFNGTVGSSWGSVGGGDSNGGSTVSVAVGVGMTVSVSVGVSGSVGAGGRTVGVVTSSDSSVVVVGAGDGWVGATGSRGGDGGVGGSGVRVMGSGASGVVGGVAPLVGTTLVAPEAVPVGGATTRVVARVGDPAPVTEVFTWSCADSPRAGEADSIRAREGT